MMERFLVAAAAFGVATFAGGLAWSAFDLYALGLVAPAILAGCLYPLRLGSLPAGE